MNQLSESGQAHELRARLPGKVVLPADDAYDAACGSWNLRGRKTPDVIVYAADAQDVSEALAFAARRNLDVVVQATGHRITVDGRGSLLINTSRMQDLAIDAEARTSRLGAGVKWGAVLAEAQKHGLAPLLGSSSDVGAVGFTLGGGMGWLSRKYGMAVDSVLRFEVVTPDGKVRTASRAANPDLFWALCGGGGGFGVVTGMEIRLHPVARVYAGNLFYPPDMAKDVFRHYREWAARAPDELTCSIVLMNIPPLPHLPPVLSGHSFVIVRGCFAGPAQDGEALLAHWRDWRAPVIDDFRERPFTESDQISQDPVDPLPALSTCEWLRDLSDEAADALIACTFPQGGPPRLIFSEVRFAGGAIACVPEDATAYSLRAGEHIWYSIGVAPDAETCDLLVRHFAQLRNALASAATGKVYINFIEGEEMAGRVQDGFSENAFRRLQSIKAQYDPDCRLVSGLEIPPLAS